MKKISISFLNSYRELVTTSVINGTTGNIEFNEEGDRIESLYEIINVQQNELKVVGNYRTNTVSWKTQFSKYFLFLCFV